MTDRLITADARTTTGFDFFRAVVQGLPPLTEAEKAEREAEKRRRMAELAVEHEREMTELRRRILALCVGDEGRERMLALWTKEGVDCTALTETLPDPVRRKAA